MPESNVLVAGEPSESVDHDRARGDDDGARVRLWPVSDVGQVVDAGR